MRLAFDRFLFDSASRELLRDGQPIPLSPKAFQLLDALIEGRPKALSKTALHDHLWPDTFVVEANLSNLVGELRRALGDDSRKPRFIRTVQRFGYAFSGEGVSENRPAQQAQAALYRLQWPGGSALLGEGDHVIGRDPLVAVVLDSVSVSRRHARIRISTDGATLEDLRSKNGVSVKGSRAVRPVVLSDGDIIRVGGIDLTFTALRSTASTKTELP